MIATAKVITQADKQSYSSLVQPGNQEWVTVIETINAAGWVLSSMIIFVSKTHCTNWFNDFNIPSNWTIKVNNNS